jgi:Pentatricopeptide repeat domain
MLVKLSRSTHELLQRALNRLKRVQSSQSLSFQTFSTLILEREGIHAIRPPSSTVQSHLDELILRNDLKASLVTLNSAMKMHINISTQTYFQVVELILRNAFDPSLATIVRKIITHLASLNSPLSADQFDQLLLLSSKYQLADRCLSLFLHASSNGFSPSSDSVVAVVRAVTQKLNYLGHENEHKVLQAYRNILTLIEKFKIPYTTDLALSILQLLTGSYASFFREMRKSQFLSSSVSQIPSNLTEEDETVHRMNSQTLDDDKLLLEAHSFFQTISNTPNLKLDVIYRDLFIACIKRGNRSAAMNVLYEMQMKKITPYSVKMFNSLIEFDSVQRANKKVHQETLELMTSSNVIPNTGTLLALMKAYLYANVRLDKKNSSNSDVATYLQWLSSHIQVPFTNQTLGFCVFYCLKHGQVHEVEELVKLTSKVNESSLENSNRPRWLRKLSQYLSTSSKTATSTSNKQSGGNTQSIATS